MESESYKHKYSKIHIENITKNILEQYFGNNLHLPINVIQLSKNMDLMVYDATFIRDDISGMIDPNEKAIYVAKNDSFRRKRFSIAHEIGHFVLHYNGVEGKTFDKDKLNKKHISYRDKESYLGFSIKEIEANHFAATLLMPKNEIEKLWKKTNDINIMADYFGVSTTAMTYRLDFLGLCDE